jgi:hypothetical protein
MGDPALLYAACSLSGSAHLYELSRRSMSSATQHFLQQKNEVHVHTQNAIALLRARLSDPKDAVLPSTIMAVAQLVMSAVSSFLDISRHFSTFDYFWCAEFFISWIETILLHFSWTLVARDLKAETRVLAYPYPGILRQYSDISRTLQRIRAAN